MYDREFRTHLASYPERSWAIILQQAWSMYLKDRINNSHSNGFDQGKQNSKGKKGDECKRYNRGLCALGNASGMNTSAYHVANMVMGPISVTREMHREQPSMTTIIKHQQQSTNDK